MFFGNFNDIGKIRIIFSEKKTKYKIVPTVLSQPCKKPIYTDNWMRNWKKLFFICERIRTWNIFKHLQIKKKITNNPIKINTNREFSSKEIQMAKNHLKRCSISLLIKEIRIKTKIHHFWFIGLERIKGSIVSGVSKV